MSSNQKQDQTYRCVQVEQRGGWYTLASIHRGEENETEFCTAKTERQKQQEANIRLTIFGSWHGSHLEVSRYSSFYFYNPPEMARRLAASSVAGRVHCYVAQIAAKRVPSKWSHFEMKKRPMTSSPRGFLRAQVKRHPCSSG